MTAPLIETAYAKINLALHVRARRTDGYHALETLFAFAEDGDRLSATLADDLTLSISGPNARGLAGEGDNLVLRAARSLQAALGETRGAALHLEKHLPVAAGLGGGSADAAAALRILARLWGIGDANDVIREIAPALGADVPACVLSETCFGIGRGDELVRISDSGLSGTPLLLVNPGIPLATEPVFAGWDGVDRGALDTRNWRAGRNDLTPAAVSLVPEIGSLLKKLAAQPGASLARMSGSGATCFALFDSYAMRDAAGLQFPFWHMRTAIR